jgi:dihydroorotate dehydrogenase (fumarate)
MNKGSSPNNEMNLSVDYLGMKLRTPLVPSASPLSERLDYIKRLEDAGAAAIVLHSLFQEHTGVRHTGESPVVGPESYLQEISQAKAAVAIPIIASLNASEPGEWTDSARQIEQAGADALELNIYWIPTDLILSGAAVEETYIEIVSAVKSVVSIPVALKLSPFFSNFANMARRLVDAGANGLVLFNRFYQPDINLRTLSVEPDILLSTPMALRLPLRWIAILHGRIKASFAATSGIHRATDVVKLLMVGADVTMLCSVLLTKSIDHIRTLEREICEWLEDHQYESLQQLRGTMSQERCPDPSAFERVQYVRGLSTSWRGSPE